VPALRVIGLDESEKVVEKTISGLGAACNAVRTTKAFLMGRVLYEQWASYWPNHGGNAPRPPGEPEEPAAAFASFINGVPKYVVSDSLDTATWNNTTIVSGDVAAQLRQIKERTDGDIGMSGSTTLVPGCSPTASSTS
jgi:dihydrofolate reductase